MGEPSGESTSQAQGSSIAGAEGGGSGEPSLTSVAPTGRLGFRGRSATPEERAHVFEAFFFEGERRIPYLQQFFVLMVLSATIAGFGLANDSAAVVIGAMLVAPLMTPILGTAASVVQGWERRMFESLAIVLGGAAVAILVGMVIALIEPRLTSGAPLPGELLGRTRPNVTDLGIALAAGAAGAFVTVRSEASSALPGVGIAVALVPPLATVGMCLGIGEADLAAGATLLFATNLVAIILAAGVVFLLAGFGAYRDVGGEQRARRIAFALVFVAILLALPLGSHGLDEFRRDRMNAIVSDTTREWAPQLDLETVELERVSDPTRVSVVLTGTEAPPPAAGLGELLAQEMDRSVVVEVVYVPVDVAQVDVP